MAEAAPHHLELIYQFLVQGTHFWVHQLLVHGQTDSEDVNLRQKQKHDGVRKKRDALAGWSAAGISRLLWPLRSHVLPKYKNGAKIS